jgi:hypothetical protein
MKWIAPNVKNKNIKIKILVTTIFHKQLNLSIIMKINIMIKVYIIFLINLMIIIVEVKKIWFSNQIKVNF